MKLILADDHVLVRDALSLLLTHGDAEFMILQAGNFPDAIELLKNNADTDLILLDVYMPGMKDMSVVRHLKESHPQVPVVLMSGRVSQKIVTRAFDLGADGFIPKTLNGEALISVLRMVKSGVRYVPEVVLERSDSCDSVQYNMSKREFEVLGQLFSGFSNKVIAQNMQVEVSTVKLHLRSLFKKLGVKNRTEAVIVARNKGLHQL